MKAQDGLRYAMHNHGRTLQLRYYTNTVGSIWDDENTWSQSGNSIYFSGLAQEITGQRGAELTLLEQGKLENTDLIFYVAGSLQTTSGLRVFTMTISGADNVFREVLPGINNPQVLGNDVYLKIYGRSIPTGSLF